MPDDARREWLQKHTEEVNPKDPRKRTYREQAYARIGKAKRAAIMENLPALGALVDAVQSRVKSQGWIRGIDGRRLPIRKAHAALNTLLQSAGALVMKKALVLMEAEFTSRGWVIGQDLAFVANIHDEVQIEAKETIADEVAAIAADAICRAGKYFEFRTELAGNACIGRTWAETH